MRIRLVRVGPLYLLGCVFGLGVGLSLLFQPGRADISLPYVLVAFGLSLLLIPAPPIDGLSRAGGDVVGNAFLYPLDSPAWSLFFEMAINALYAACFRWITWPVLIAAAAVGLAGLALAATVHGNLFEGWRWSGVWVGGARILYGFAGGVIVARWGRTIRLPGGAATPMLILAAILLVPLSGVNRAAYDFVAVAAMPLLVMAGAGVEPPARLHRLARYLGVTSYAVYVLHVPLLNLVADWRPFLPPVRNAVAFIVYLAALTLFVVLADRYWDRPIRARLRAAVRSVLA